jgi:tetratricopeptide (TPR) repeat protein
MYSAKGDTQASIHELDEAIRLNPKEAEYHYKLGLAWAELGDLDKTIAALRDTTALDPANSRAWYNLGLALNSQHQVEPALQALDAAFKAAPNDASIPYAKATILVQLGRKPEAEQEIFKALNAQPNYREALELRERLKNPQQ